jgi:hypothetical protein
MSPIDGVRSEREPQCHATRWSDPIRRGGIPPPLSSGPLNGAPSTCQKNKSSRRGLPPVPIPPLLAEFASCRAPQSARALSPLWPDIRAVPPVPIARSAHRYSPHAPHNWPAISPRRTPAPYLPRRWQLASDARKNEMARTCRICRSYGCNPAFSAALCRACRTFRP